MKKSKNSKSAISMAMIAGGMLCMAYAAFPLYNLFCKITGYGGTTQDVAQPSNFVGSKDIEVRFNADVNRNLPWDFKPLQKSVKLKVGENALIHYQAQNLSDQEMTSVATFNVTPNEAGAYFNKIECFCFQNQTLKPGEMVKMPVSFYIDPKIEQDTNIGHIDSITLSYTFFESE